MERWFQIRERGSSVRVEVLGGATRFVTMAYILAVNPAILSFAGLPLGPGAVVLAALCLVGYVFGFPH